MKYVYLIMNEQYMPELQNHVPYGTAEFSFTSLERAEKQMDTIVELVNQDKWYINAGHHVCFDRRLQDCSPLHLLRSIKIQHPNGTYTIYSMQRIELNAAYGI